MSSRSIAAAALCILSFNVIAPQTLAFIDTENLEEQMRDMETGATQDGNLGSLLGDLEDAAGSEADNYLQTTIDGKNVTVWDVPKDAWFYTYVLALMELGIVSGYRDAEEVPTGAYGPGDNVTREQALKIALNAANVDVSGCEGDLETTKVSEWAKPFTACAAAMGFGITVGTDLRAPATRSEVLHYLLRAFNVEAAQGTPPFADATAHAYKNDIAYAYALGIVAGNPDGTFAPDRDVNRAETAKMAKLAMELL